MDGVRHMPDERGADLPVTRRFLRQVLDPLAKETGKMIRESRESVTRELKGAIEGLPHDGGVYVNGQRYRKGAICTYGGPAFIAQCDTDAPIGGTPPSPDWRLMVQRGKSSR
jgi:hypothetical protein